jgi:phosphate starvation-inducible PhoH-like protein
MPIRKQKTSNKNSIRKEASKPLKPTSSNKNFHIEFKNEAQSLAWSAFKKHDVLFLVGPAGTGKALTMNSKLYTRNGCVLMKSIKVGDEVANPDGGFSKVTGVFPQGKKQVCRVYFNDGNCVDCCEEHLWRICLNEDKESKVVDTKYIELNCNKKNKIFVSNTEPVNFDKKTFEISPYFMGFIISSELNSDNEIVLNKNCYSFEKIKQLSNGEFEFKEDPQNFNLKIKDFETDLNYCNFSNLKSSEKFIPENYQYGSIDQRIALIKGLLDGVKFNKKNKYGFYSTTSHQLAQDFCQVIFSLGGLAKIKIKEKSFKLKENNDRISYQCVFKLPPDIEIFFLNKKNRLNKSKKKCELKRFIDRVERLNAEEMQCISVDHKNSLYLTDNYIPTHNTHLASAFAIEQVLNKQKSRIILTRPIVESGESLGFLPGEFEEKVHPYMMPLYDCLDLMVGKEGHWRERVDQAVEVAPIAYMRGRSFHDAICIFDEAQNASLLQLKLFLTRFGENSKIIVTGDPNQSDIGGKVALVEVIRKLKGTEGIGIFEFDSSSIVRHKLVGKIIEKLES